MKVLDVLNWDEKMRADREKRPYCIYLDNSPTQVINVTRDPDFTQSTDDEKILSGCPGEAKFCFLVHFKGVESRSVLDHDSDDEDHVGGQKAWEKRVPTELTKFFGAERLKHATYMHHNTLKIVAPLSLVRKLQKVKEANRVDWIGLDNAKRRFLSFESSTEHFVDAKNCYLMIDEVFCLAEKEANLIQRKLNTLTEEEKEGKKGRRLRKSLKQAQKRVQEKQSLINLEEMVADWRQQLVTFDFQDLFEVEVKPKIITKMGQTLGCSSHEDELKFSWEVALIKLKMKSKSDPSGSSPLLGTSPSDGVLKKTKNLLTLSSPRDQKKKENKKASKYIRALYFWLLSQYQVKNVFFHEHAFQTLANTYAREVLEKV